MSLATRCVACGTVFRVVQDQLRVSSGWVRCGRCSEVFNAIESLVDLDGERPDPADASTHGMRVMEELARVSGLGGFEPESDAAQPVPPSDNGPAAPVAQDSAPPPLAEPPAPGPEPATSTAVASATFDAEEPATSTFGADAHDRAEDRLQGLRQPAFIRQADRAARWRRPWVRGGLGVTLTAMGALLAWQVHDSHHDWLAARWPAARPAIERLCALSGCRVEPPRWIDGWVVESSGLVRTEGVQTYRLDVTLRNRAHLAILVPAVDLVMSDASGSTVARRVLRPVDLGYAANGIGPGGELAMSALLQLQGTPVVGYTIEIFYP